MSAPPLRPHTILTLPLRTETVATKYFLRSASIPYVVRRSTTPVPFVTPSEELTAPDLASLNLENVDTESPNPDALNVNDVETFGGIPFYSASWHRPLLAAPDYAILQWHDAAIILARHLKQFSPWLYMTLHPMLMFTTGDLCWRVVVLVQQPLLTPLKEGWVPTGYKYWNLHVPASSCVRGRMLHDPILRPGMSIGQRGQLEDTELRACTIGGFVVGQKTGKVYAITAGVLREGQHVIVPAHDDAVRENARLVADEVVLEDEASAVEDAERDLHDELNSARLTMGWEFNAQHEEAYALRLAALAHLKSEMEAKKQGISNARNDLERAVRRGAVGTVKRREFKNTDEGFKSIGIVEIKKGLVVGNFVPTIFPDGRNFFADRDGELEGEEVVVDEPIENLRVVKIGKETGVTEGSILELKDVFWSERLGMVRVDATDGWAREGDAGAWLWGEMGEVVGMVVGAVEASDKKVKDKIYRTLFVPMKKVMEWAEQFCFEEVSILPLNMAFSTTPPETKRPGSEITFSVTQHN